LTPEEFDMAVIPDAPNFLEKDDIKDLVKAAKAAGEWDLIIVDTYAQVMPGGDENGATDSGRVLGHCKLLNKVTGAMVLIVHHTGKDSSRGARGWSGMKGAMDVEIMVERGAADYREVRVTKMKDGEGEGDKYGFSLHTVALGQDEDGEAITSCVVSATERRASTPLVAATGPHQHAVMSAFETMEDLGGEIEIEKLVANVVAQVAPGLDGKTPKNAARDAKRAIRALIDKGLLVEIGEILARP
jgi:RecA-family ATPase